MSVNVWDALEGDWYYLGRPVPGGFDIATLRPAGAAAKGGRAGAAVAAAFTSEEAAAEFRAAAPDGIELLSVAADDQRAKEEWLRALVEQGARRLLFDPGPEALSDPEAASFVDVHTALGYILSFRRSTACL